MPKTALNPNGNAVFNSYKIFALLIIAEHYKTLIIESDLHNISFGYTWNYTLKFKICARIISKITKCILAMWDYVIIKWK